MSDYRNFRANQNKPAGGFTNNYSLPDKNDDEYTEEDLTQVKSQIRNVKQESANATRQAVARLAQTEDIAVNTMEKLGTQSEKINNVDRSMKIAELQADLALEQSAELKRINNSMFSFFKNPFKSKSKSELEIERLKREHSEQIQRDDETRKANFEAKNRIHEAVKDSKNHTVSGGSLPMQNNSPSYSNISTRSAPAKSKYNFEEDAEGQALEDEIDGNLDIISGQLNRLKNLSLNMSNELDVQNGKIKDITKNSESVHEKLVIGQNRIKNIK